MKVQESLKKTDRACCDLMLSFLIGGEEEGVASGECVYSGSSLIL